MNDIRLATRQLWKAPAFTLLAVFSLAVGIGINSTIFSVMDAAFLRPLPVERPDQIVKFERPAISFEEFKRIGATMTSLSVVVASNRVNLLLKGSERLEPINARMVSGNYFSLFGVKPHLGRFFSDGEGDAAAMTVVISHALWQRRFGSEHALIGQPIVINGQSVVVLGVAPPGFTGEERLPPTEVWYPAESRPSELRDGRRVFQLTGRLRSGFSPTQAQSEAATIFQRPEWESLRGNRFGERVRVVSERQARMDHGGRLTFFSGPLVGLVLLVACANVSCLLLGRNQERQRDIAVRLALGASRGRIFRYLLTEALLLSVVGGSIALLITQWGVAAIPSLVPPMLSAWVPTMHLDGRVLSLTLALSAAATLMFGFLPAWKVSRLDVSEMLKAERGRVGKTPSRSVLVVVQVVIAVAFLTLATLFIRSFLAGGKRDLGFAARNVLFAQLVAQRRMPSELSPVFDEIRRTVDAIPGVRSVTLANNVLGGQQMPVTGPEELLSAGGKPPVVSCNIVDPGYFQTLGISVVAGRDFSGYDNSAGARVAIVSEVLAKRFWPRADPIGKVISVGRSGVELREIVGIVRDVAGFEERETPEPLLYFPLRQEQFGQLLVIVNTVGTPASFAPALRTALHRMDATITPILFDTIQDRMRAAMLPQWFGACLGGILGALAFVLAISGLYGVVSYAVSTRTRELGIRIAIGATPTAAIWLVMRQGAILTLIGVSLGVPVAIAAATVLQSTLPGISPADPVGIATAALVVVVIALLACFVPALRAARVNPVDALRVS